METAVLFFLRDGPKRYGELKRLVQGVSDKVLIQQLKDLEADRVLARTDYKEVPPRVDYALTPLGRSLADAIAPLCTWEPRTRRKWQASSPSATLCPARCRKIAETVAVRLTNPSPFTVVGSPEYFAKRGKPQRPEEPAEHGCINFRQISGRLYRWAFAERLESGNSRAFEIGVGPDPNLEIHFAPHPAYQFDLPRGVKIKKLAGGTC